MTILERQLTELGWGGEDTSFLLSQDHGVLKFPTVVNSFTSIVALVIVVFGC